MLPLAEMKLGGSWMRLIQNRGYGIRMKSEQGSWDGLDFMGDEVYPDGRNAVKLGMHTKMLLNPIRG